MTNQNDAISKSRKLLQNPYAYLDDRGSYSVLLAVNGEPRSLSARIAENRRSLQNPYAYGDEGLDSALSGYAEIGSAKPTSSYTNRDIQKKAKELHREIWHRKDEIWGDSLPRNPIDMLDPSVGLGLLGYDYVIEETLGQYRANGREIEAAGLIDTVAKRVQISGRFPNSVRVFTAAHELGHAVLHKTAGLHRDRPLDGGKLARDAMEREADRFATYFLMPEKLVRAGFSTLFLTDRFSVNEETAFALSRISLHDFRLKCKTRHDLSRALAGAQRYNGRHFTSLADQFRVSIEAMAIRLEELAITDK